MSEFWQNKIKAFLHDPPDKALILFHKSHEKKAADIWENIGLIEDAKRLKDFIEKRKCIREAFPKIHNADIIASSMQRLDIPEDYRMDDARSCGTHICFKGNLKPVFKHTLSGAVEDLKEVKDFIATYSYKKALEEYGFKPNVVKNFLSKDWKKTYFLLWRFLSDQYDLGHILPADTRIPDHSILDHLDVTSAIFSSLEGGLCLFAVKIPAVQEFIAHSRKLADLWASSHIFSTIIFEGIKVVAEELGPDVVIYPQLRGNPMVDLAEFTGEDDKFRLFNEGKNLGLINEGEEKEINKKLQAANFPNTFVCFVLPSEAKKIANEVEKAIKSKWKKITEEAKKLLENIAKIKTDEGLWDKQIDGAIEITSVWLEFFNFDKFNNVKNEIPNDLKKRQENWLKFTEDSKSYKGLKVERHGLNRYKIFEGNIEKLNVIADNEEEFAKECIKVFDNEKVKVLKSLYEWLRRDPSHFYCTTYELLGTILTQKSRFWNAWEEKPITGKKCLMCGRRNALIERFRDEKSDKEFYRYWRDNKWENKSIEELGKFRYLLKEGERLCAVCLTKRLYGWRTKSVFEKIFGVKPPEQESVVHIAARDFIENFSTHPILGKIIEKDIELIYEHEWGESEEKIPEEKRNVIEELKKELEKSWKELKDEVKKSYEQLNEKPNKYYAILMMDGDRVGRMLSGETLPNLEEFMHPVFKNKILEWGKGEELIKTKRILTPSHHIAISRAMKDFSLYKVPEIVEKFNGFLVYAGGDDVLALFPADKVLDAAYEIQKFFKKDFYEIEVNGKKRKVIGLGNKASMSAGIVFAHYKWPLYDAIERVRDAEKDAKGKYGRNAFCITFIKRSGEILTTGGKWDFVADLTNIAKAIVNRKISHRFIYDFMDVNEILEGDMLKAEVRRLLKRRKEGASDEETKEIQGKLLCLIEKYQAQSLSIKELGNALKILYDAYRGEER